MALFVGKCSLSKAANLRAYALSSKIISSSVTFADLNQHYLSKYNYDNFFVSLTNYRKLPKVTNVTFRVSILRGCYFRGARKDFKIGTTLLVLQNKTEIQSRYNSSFQFKSTFLPHK